MNIAKGQVRELPRRGGGFGSANDDEIGGCTDTDLSGAGRESQNSRGLGCGHSVDRFGRCSDLMESEAQLIEEISGTGERRIASDRDVSEIRERVWGMRALKKKHVRTGTPDE